MPAACWFCRADDSGRESGSPARRSR